VISGDVLDRRIRIERAVSDESFDGAGSGAWELVAEVWAGVKDALPSRGEQLADGINFARRPARVRIRYRAGISAAMRIDMGRNVKDADGATVWQSERIAQIISEPAEIGRRDGIEFMVEDYSPAGNGA
jgi:head-tail adaptor